MGQGQAVSASQASPAAGSSRPAGGASSNGRKLEDVCEVDRTKPLGQGSFGTVWRAKLCKSGAPAAVKAMDKKKMRDMNVPAKLVHAEVEFMRECSGKAWFVSLIDFIEAKGSYFIVMELCSGDLEGAAKECEGKLGEEKVVCMMEQMLKGIAFLHSRSICHRDVKPQNAMIVGRPTSDDVKVKLADFGIAARVKQGQLLTEKVGTPAFMAPEMHLLPGKSAGYDCKVDLWAAGAVVVFLLAFEYPFVDGSGRLLQNQLLRGDLPLWDTDVFSGLFQRVQEAAGIRRKRPSKTARDLVRQLLNPKRHHRLSAARALQHAWFKPGTDYSDRGDDLPLLEWSDFEEGFSSIERELQRVAAGVADAAAGVAHVVGEVQIDTGCEPPLLLDPSDDRVRSCVVCYQSSGNLGYRCPQCHHTVCLTCLERLPKAECPACRHVAHDVALTQKVARLARTVTAEAGGLAAGASEGIGKVTAGIAVDVDVGDLAPRSEEERRRRAVCHFCQAESSATSHVCPLCSSSVCLPCCRRELSTRPRCPNCKDRAHNAQAIRELLAAGEAWDSLSAMPGILGARASFLIDSLATRASEAAAGLTSRPPEDADALATRRARDAGTTGRPNPFATDTGAEAAAAAAAAEPAEPAEPWPRSPDAAVSSSRLRRSLTEQAQLQMSHCCHFCGKASTALDLACPSCSTSVCVACLRELLPEDNSCCPSCHHPEFCNARSLRLVLSAARVRDSAESLWHGIVDIGQELFSIEGPPAAGAAAAPPGPSPRGAAGSGDPGRGSGGGSASTLGGSRSGGPGRGAGAAPDGSAGEGTRGGVRADSFDDGSQDDDIFDEGHAKMPTVREALPLGLLRKGEFSEEDDIVATTL